MIKIARWGGQQCRPLFKCPYQIVDLADPAFAGTLQLPPFCCPCFYLVRPPTTRLIEVDMLVDILVATSGAKPFFLSQPSSTATRSAWRLLAQLLSGMPSSLRARSTNSSAGRLCGLRLCPFLGAAAAGSWRPLSRARRP